MSTHPKRITYISIAAVLSIGLLASFTQSGSAKDRSVQVKLIPIKEYAINRNVQSVSEPDTVARK